MGCDASDHGDGAHGGGGSATSRLWYLGVILSIVGSIGTNLGVNLQKYSFMCEGKRCVRAKRSYLRQPLWVIGLLLVIAGSGLDFVALGFLPQSLATPVGGTTMVANVAFASLLLKEKFSRLDAIGTSLILGGICLTAAFANKESDCYTVDQLVGLYGEPMFVVYIILMVLACLGLFGLVKRVERILQTVGTGSPAYRRFAKIHPVAYPALSGIFGAQSVLFAKSVAELVKTTADGTNQFAKFGTYAITLSMFSCVFLQIHWLAHGLQSFDAVFIVPVFQCFFISVSIFGGGVYFKEFATMSTLALAMFFLGACITLSGVYLLSRREMNRLRPTGKLRAAVKMIIFIKRTQKARNLEYRWRQLPQPELFKTDAATGGGVPAVTKSAQQHGSPSASLFGVKLSKASVMPIDGQCPSPPPPPRNETAATPDTSSSQIETPLVKPEHSG